jgi:CheY-like chemotaxis protein
MSLILLIEDDSAVRQMLRLTLEQQGHTVVEAADGNEGVALAAEEDFDVILTDIIMPERDGLEVIMTIRRSNPQIKIIAMSGGGRVSAMDYLQIARSMGAVRILAKPFSNKQLNAAISEAIGSSAPGKPGP